MAHLRSLAGIMTLLLVIAILFPAASLGQSQPYVGRYDQFSGFTYMASPKMNLYQRGYNGEFGVNVNRWLAMGVDYSIMNGGSSILPTELATAQKAKLAPFLPLLPPGYTLQVPFTARTQTFSAGPQVNIRKWRPVTFFVRPALGALHEQVTIKPSDPFQTAVVNALAPGGKKTDTVVFYGFGGGFDANLSDHFAIRVGCDFVHMFLFDGLLEDPRNSVRLSIGPAFRFGRNVESKK